MTEMSEADESDSNSVEALTVHGLQEALFGQLLGRRLINLLVEKGLITEAERDTLVEEAHKATMGGLLVLRDEGGIERLPDMSSDALIALYEQEFKKREG